MLIQGLLYSAVTAHGQMEMPVLLTWLSVVLIYVLTTAPQKEQNA